jgi:ribosome maturation factor RimP
VREISLFKIEGENMIEEKIFKSLEEKLLEVEIKLVEVLYTKESGENILRITIDKDTLINIDDCLLATKIINPILDKDDYIKESYILDVCSIEKGGEE